MHMFRTIGFFAAFLAVAYAAPTPTQSGKCNRALLLLYVQHMFSIVPYFFLYTKACSNELSVIGHAHDAAEQIQKNLFAMQGNYNGQPPPESVL